MDWDQWRRYWNEGRKKSGCNVFGTCPRCKHASLSSSAAVYTGKVIKPGVTAVFGSKDIANGVKEPTDNLAITYEGGFKKVSGKTYYSSWSKAKTARTK